MATILERERVWQDFAACVNQTELFYPDRSDDLAIARARNICLTECPVRQECADYAERTRQKDGIWGGVFLEVGTSKRKKLCCPRCESTDLGAFDGQLECFECGFKWVG